MIAASPIFLFAGTGLNDVHRVDLQGRSLVTAPNTTVVPGAGPPLILKVEMPNLLIQKSPIQPSHGTILIFPGGGYQVLAIQHEGITVADLLNSQGYDTAILEYSIGGSDAREQALGDAIKAVKLIQGQAADLGINASSLGLMGFSAGGHLAARLLPELGSPSPFSQIILIYPAYLNAPSGILPEVTPPKGVRCKTFVLIGAMDKPEWVSSAAAYVKVSKANAQVAEFHLLPDVGHGFGIQAGQSGVIATWPSLLENFLSKK